MGFRKSLSKFIKETVLFISCLAITFVLFVALISILVFRNFYKKSNGLTVSKNNEKIEKDIKAKVFLFADIESDVDSLKQSITTVNDNLKSVDRLVILMGDITSLGVIDDMEKVKNEMDKSKMTYYAVPGDRDLWKSHGLKNFNQVFGSSYYLKDIDGVKFMFIDNADEYAGISDDQFKFIKDNISDTDFIFLHNPIFFGGNIFKKLFRKGMGQYSGDVDVQRIELLKIIRNSNVKSVFAGDQHVYSESKDDVKDTLMHYVVGSLNRSRSVGNASYAILTIYNDNSYSVENFPLAK